MCVGRAASGGALAPEPQRATRSQPEFRGARRRRALARRTVDLIQPFFLRFEPDFFDFFQVEPEEKK